MPGKVIIFMDRLKVYRFTLIIILIINLIFLGYYYVYSITSEIPDSIKVYVDDENKLDFDVPATADINCSKEVISISNASSPEKDRIHFSLMEPFTVQSETKGSYEMSLKLFGLFDVKKVSLDVIDSTYLSPCGNAIGIRLDTDGLLVLGTGTVSGIDGLEYEPAKQIIRTGDYIIEINGKKVDTIKNMQQQIQKVKKDEVVVKIRRNGLESNIKIPIVRTKDGGNMVGIWVRENTQGIGTLTYITKDNTYGALGHGVTDSDTGVLMELSEGNIYNTEILKIIKGRNGAPGELMGMILESSSQRIGSIDANTELGIRGTINADCNTDEFAGKPIPVALRQEIKKGKASIICQLEDEISEYDAEIIDIDRGSNDNKGLIIQITDKELLEKTGGIIQGMSGSPILQDGKIVGAVTHVFVNDPTKGYGVFIENMLEQ